MTDTRYSWADTPDPGEQPDVCTDCGGAGHLKLDAPEIERWNSGIRHVAKRHAWQLVTCKACRGTGRKRGKVVKAKSVRIFIGDSEIPFIRTLVDPSPEQAAGHAYAMHESVGWITTTEAELRELFEPDLQSKHEQVCCESCEDFSPNGETGGRRFGLCKRQGITVCTDAALCNTGCHSSLRADSKPDETCDSCGLFRRSGGGYGLCTRRGVLIDPTHEPCDAWNA
jgi:hypothetical protein